MRICFLTPTWRGDLHHFRMLRQSMQRYGLGAAPHRVVVHTEDVDLFRPLVSGGLKLVTTAEVLPASVEQGRLLCMRRNGGDGSRRAKFWRSLSKRMNLFRWTRYFGWQVQQLTKLQAPVVFDDDVQVVIDSDQILCGPLDLQEFVSNGRAQLLDNRQVMIPEQDRLACRWAATAHQLFGMEFQPLAPHNYRLGTPVVFERGVMAALHAELERRHGQPWFEVLLGQKPMSWSEFMLYNTYAERHVGTRLERRAGDDGLQEMCLHTAEHHRDAERLIREAFTSSQVRFLRIQSEARGRTDWTGAEFERHVQPFLVPGS